MNQYTKLEATYTRQGESKQRRIEWDSSLVARDGSAKLLANFQDVEVWDDQGRRRVPVRILSATEQNWRRGHNHQKPNVWGLVSERKLT